MMTPDVMAYLDPGAGSVILQFLAAIMIGASVMFRRTLAGFFSVFRRGDKLGSPESPSDNG